MKAGIWARGHTVPTAWSEMNNVKTEHPLIKLPIEKQESVMLTESPILKMVEDVELLLYTQYLKITTALVQYITHDHKLALEGLENTHDKP